MQIAEMGQYVGYQKASDSIDFCEFEGLRLLTYRRQVPSNQSPDSPQALT